VDVLQVLCHQWHVNEVWMYCRYCVISGVCERGVDVLQVLRRSLLLV